MEPLARVVVAAGGIGPFAKVVGWYHLLDRIQLDIRIGHSRIVLMAV